MENLKIARLGRRAFVRVAGVVGASALASPFLRTAAGEAPVVEKLVKFPEKLELILRTDRPPQLETPLRYFREDLTPNEAFYVRWHLEGIPTSVNTREFRLQISPHESRPTNPH